MTRVGFEIHVDLLLDLVLRFLADPLHLRPFRAAEVVLSRLIVAKTSAITPTITGTILADRFQAEACISITATSPMRKTVNSSVGTKRGLPKSVSMRLKPPWIFTSCQNGRRRPKMAMANRMTTSGRAIQVTP